MVFGLVNEATVFWSVLDTQCAMDIGFKPRRQALGPRPSFLGMPASLILKQMWKLKFPPGT